MYSADLNSIREFDSAAQALIMTRRYARLAPEHKMDTVATLLESHHEKETLSNSI